MTKKLILAAFALVLLTGFTTLSDRLMSVNPAAAPSSYTGPGDINSGALVFYSCGRAYNAAYATALSAACDVVDTATGLTSCTLHFLSTGYVNTTQCNATACAVACSISKFYDQSGNANDATQATLAKMAGLTFSALNGLPCGAGIGSAGTGGGNLTYTSANTITQAQPYTSTAVAERTGSFTTLQRIIISDTTGGRIFFAGSANTISGNSGASVSLTAADNSPHAMLLVSNSSNPLFAIDSSGNTSTSTNGTNAMSSNEFVMNNGSAPILSGYFCEGGVWPADLGSSYTTMLANMRSATVGWNF